jgi:plasmid stabilization system protein ParE
MIGHAPHVGRLYRQSPIAGARRLLLEGTRYHVYYVARADEVRVLAVWNARRGVGPPLRA